MIMFDEYIYRTKSGQRYGLIIRGNKMAQRATINRAVYVSQDVRLGFCFPIRMISSAQKLHPYLRI